MADLLPSTPDTSAAEEAEPRVVGLDSEDADDLMSALSSSTARELLAALHDSPATPSELADEVGTSLQNAQYHIEKLENADIIEVIDTAYSAKGREMKVYAPTDQPLVVFAGREEQSTGLKAALSRLLGGLGAVALGALTVQQVFGDGLDGVFGPPSATGGGGDGDAAAAGGASGDGGAGAVGASGSGGTTSTPTPTPQATETQTVVEQATTGSNDVGIMSVEETTQATKTVTESGGNGGGALSTTAEPTQVAATTTDTAFDAANATAANVSHATTTNAGHTTTEAARTAAEASAGLPPGVLFFLGGAFVVVGSVALWYLRN